MLEIIILAAAGAIMLREYARTKRPLLYATFNMLVGISLLMAAGCFFGLAEVNYLTSAASLILGIPAVICICVASLL